MSICGTLGTLILTATLLGQQKLALDTQLVLKAPGCVSESELSNATLTLKDSLGATVYSSKINVPRYRYYTNDARETAEGCWRSFSGFVSGDKSKISVQLANGARRDGRS